MFGSRRKLKGAKKAPEVSDCGISEALKKSPDYDGVLELDFGKQLLLTTSGKIIGFVPALAGSEFLGQFYIMKNEAIKTGIAQFTEYQGYALIVSASDLQADAQAFLGKKIPASQLNNAIDAHESIIEKRRDDAAKFRKQGGVIRVAGMEAKSGPPRSGFEHGQERQ